MIREKIQTSLYQFFSDQRTPSTVRHFDKSELIQILNIANMSDIEYFIFSLALLPHTDPHFLHQSAQDYLPSGSEFPELGGVRSDHFRGIYPTLETALFFLAPSTESDRREIFDVFHPDHFFNTENILRLEEVESGAPFLARKLVISDEVLLKIIFGVSDDTKFKLNRFATLLSTELDWPDLVLPERTMSLLEKVRVWLQFESMLDDSDWNLSKYKSKGFKALFYGPPGTGKTLSATLIAQDFGIPLYRIDLSQVVSKYIGETEKNLENIFIKAEKKQCMLFFDEAEALFGSRTQTKTSNDRFANQQISYLLQRIENFPGYVLLASNLKQQMDTAFLRRLQVLIPFTQPDAEDRLRIWTNMMPTQKTTPELNEKIKLLAEKYELTGAQIANVIVFAALQTLQQNAPHIQVDFLLDGIRYEIQKEDKIFKPIELY